jgi:hypothetical protein
VAPAGINPRRIGIIAGILVLLLVLMEFNARLEELNRLSAQRQIVRAQATTSMQTQVALLTQVAQATSDREAEAWARSDGHFIQPGDRPVVPIAQPGTAPIAQVTPIPTSIAPSHWQVWWDVFFSD